MKPSKEQLKIALRYLFLAVLILILFIAYKKLGHHLKYLRNPEYVRSWIMSFGKFGAFAYILIQILQIVVSFVPGEVIQIAGGYVFGTFTGTLLSIAGVLAGSIIAFMIARTFGERLIKRIIPEKEYIRMGKVINRPDNRIVLFVLYLIPGIPKDILGYIAGVTSIKLKEFAVITTTARIPGVLMSSYFGSNLHHRHYNAALIFASAIIVLLIVIAFKKDKILAYFREESQG